MLSDARIDKTLPIRAQVGWGRRLMWAGVIGVWLALVLVGTFAMQHYGSTPSAKDSAPPEWPSSSRIARDAGRPQLVMLAHPHCPCTRASLAELSRLLTTLSGRLGVHVLFVRPKGVEADWESTDLLEQARGIPGAVVELDEGGREAALFGARTSGDAVLYGEDGRLLFHGGITPSRGHQGDNVGSLRITSLVTTGSKDLAESAVFGCELLNDGNP